MTRPAAAVPANDETPLETANTVIFPSFTRRSDGSYMLVINGTVSAKSAFLNALNAAFLP